MRVSAPSSPGRRAESSLLRPTLLGLLRLGWINQMSLADVEVRWHQKRIDLAFLAADEEAGAVAVELKVNSTGRAIDQAQLNRYLTPASWVATWAMPSPDILRRAQSRGVGLLLITERGAYPLVHPSSGELRTNLLTEHLRDRRRRVRDLLSTIRHG